MNNSTVYIDSPLVHKEKIDKLLRETKANNNLAPLDSKLFWAEQDKAIKDPFKAAQCPFGAILNWECLFDELGIEQDWQRFLFDDREWARDISEQFNDKAEEIVGKRILPIIDPNPDPNLKWPEVKGLHDIFEAKNEWEGGASGSWWLKQAANTTEELSALLDRVEKRLDNLHDFLFPENWDDEKKRLTGLGKTLPLYRGQRGPCTFATSVFGTENMLFLLYDDPALFRRFGDIIGRAILGRAQAIDKEAGYTEETKPHGWAWADDNCCLFTPDMYETLAMPIHEKIFTYYSPNKENRRYQHSDSNMAHLLPLLKHWDLTGTNFGPTLSVSEIRDHCPNAVIDGQMAPFTYSRNEEENMLAEFFRDFAQAKAKRGLKFTTAGSINNGSRLTGMRLLMSAIQQYGQY